MTADSAVLDRAGAWLNLTALVFQAEPPRWLLDLSASNPEEHAG
ncbi:hypothetical protein [Hymenobacter cellulosilyticus]|nr:hypothetical protein [Hymenobacter cellulosilyticus]